MAWLELNYGEYLINVIAHAYMQCAQSNNENDHKFDCFLSVKTVERLNHLHLAVAQRTQYRTVDVLSKGFDNKFKEWITNGEQCHDVMVYVCVIMNMHDEL